MELTIGNLKVGSRIQLGAYGVTGMDEQPIVWLKATDDNKFITEHVIDYLAFDAREPNNTANGCDIAGNYDYDLSNIRQFLNSDEEHWYNPCHEYDTAPNGGLTTSHISYERHYGFLNRFKDYEIASMINAIDLPSVHEIVGEDRFKIFKRKGVRPTATEMMWSAPRKWMAGDYTDGSFVEFWLRDACYQEPYARYKLSGIIDRCGYVSSRAPREGAGVRPVCCIRADTKIDIGEDGIFVISPFEVMHEAYESYTNEELMMFLGLR